MANIKKDNLFYQLYSRSNNTLQSGYVCNSAVDEADTSFDISDGAGVITDSNGSTLSSIDLSQIHADGLTQYATDAKILQPYSACLIQGPDQGLAYASYFYKLPYKVKSTEGYESYLDVDFDLIYNTCNTLKYHVEWRADGKTSFVAGINNNLSEVQIPVQISIQNINDLECYRQVLNQYIVFLSLTEGLFYYLTNLRIVPKFRNEDYPDSPFIKQIGEMDQLIIDLLNEKKPVPRGAWYADGQYEPDCDLYNFLRYNYEDCVKDLATFKKALDKLDTIKYYMDAEKQQEIYLAARQIVEKTVYIKIFDKFDTENLHIIYDIIDSIKKQIELTNDYYEPIYWLNDDRRKRVAQMKYPNGACRGMVIIPEWPTNYAEEFETSNLWINHVKTTIKMWEKGPNGWQPRNVGVIANATLMSEQDCFTTEKGGCCSCCSNGNMCCNVDNGWNDGIMTTDTLKTDIAAETYAADKSIEDDMYMGRNCYPTKKNMIGLYKYMGWVNENNLWTKIGEGYMIVGSKDDPQSKVKNLIPSAVVYNPNPVPIRIKYMIFS